MTSLSRKGSLGLGSIVVVALAAGTFLSPAPAQAKGCIKGAIVGGVAGHFVGHGGLGAAAGCVVGRRNANQRSQAQGQQVAPQR